MLIVAHKNMRNIEDNVYTCNTERDSIVKTKIQKNKKRIQLMYFLLYFETNESLTLLIYKQ